MKKETAILIAAGAGSRLLPLTDKIPKPLIKVHGKPMIETNIEALQRRNVDTIYIVVGYLKEQFYYLKEKYDNIVFIENKEYKVKNNISSVYALGDILGSSDCFISDSDLYIVDPDIYISSFHQSCFFAKYVQGETNEWFYETEKNRICRLKKGGRDGYNMADISFWRKDDAILLRKIISDAYHQGNSDMLLWEQVIAAHFHSLNVFVHEIQEGQIFEIDTFLELCAQDSSYVENLNENENKNE